MSKKITYSNGETPRICIVGAGFSGLCAAIQLKKQLGLTSFTIYETNKDIGGTWLTNTYPGCACDVPSHAYSFSFEPNPDWSQNYSSQPEIWRYLKKVTDKHNLYPHIKFETEIKTMTWDEAINKWRVFAVDKNSNAEENKLYDVIINGPGGLRLPNVPEQFLSFKAPLIHSAQWDPSVSLDNKIVGVIGSGASAIQIIPNIAKSVKELHAYQRKPAWVVPRAQGYFSGLTKTIFFYFPFIMWLFRCALFLVNESLHSIFKHDSWLNRQATKYALYNMKKQVRGNEELQNQLTPYYTFGCKRLLPSGEYYPALTLPNVTVHSQKITEVTSHGIITEDGNLQNLDVLILATGYRVHDYFAPMKMYGRNSENILSTWQSKAPEHYYGIVGHSAPNHFILLGPNTALGHNTVVFMIECQVNFTINVLREMMRRDARHVSVLKSSQDEHMKWIRDGLKNTVWGKTKCGSWYENKAGIVTTLWPESCISYWKKTRNTNFAHFEFK